MYKNASEVKLLKQITLSELTAVAYLKDPKVKRDHTFGIYSPSKNYHFQGQDERDAREWVELIRSEARIDEDGDPMMPGSLPLDSLTADEQETPRALEQRTSSDRLASSSPEPPDNVSPTSLPAGFGNPRWRKASFPEVEYSGNEGASYSDFSDAGPPLPLASSNRSGPGSLPTPKLVLRKATQDHETALAPNTATLQGSSTSYIDNQLDGATADIDKERVIWHGYLLLLKVKGGMRQWKKLWVVLRPRNVAFYKNEEVSLHDTLVWRS